MFLIRSTTVEDVPTLLKLPRLVPFITLPAARDILTPNAHHSQHCPLPAAADSGACSNDRAKPP